MEFLNLNTTAIIINQLTGIIVLLGKIIPLFSIFHSKHRIKELKNQINLANKYDLPVNTILSDTLDSLLFKIIFGFWINHKETKKKYYDYFYLHNLTPLMLKSLYNRGYLLIENNKIVTHISITHKIKFYLFYVLAIVFFLIFIAIHIFAIFIPVEANNYAPLILVIIGLLFLILSIATITVYISPYNWAKANKKKETKLRT